MLYWARVDFLSLFQVVAQVEARDAGRITGGILASVFLLLGLVKCVRIMRRETTSAICVSALAVALAGWFLSTLFGVVTRTGMVPRVVEMLIAAVIVMFFPVALVLAIVGLVQYRARGFRQGRAQAIWAIVIACLMMSAFVVGFVVAAAGKPFSKPMAKAERLVMEDCNFAITAPDGWLKIDPKALGAQDAALAFRHFNPEMYAMVFAEPLGDGLAMDEFTEVVKQNMKAGADIKEQEEEEVTRNGFTFRRIRTHGSMKRLTLELYYEHWLLTHGGTFWQVVLWGPVREKGMVQDTASKFADRFEVLDRDRRYHATGTLEDADLPAYGIKTNIAGKGWNHLAADDSASPLIRVAGERLYEAFVVLPVRTDEEMPEVEALTGGLLALLDFSYPINAHASEKPITSTVGDGIEILTERDTTSGEYEYILRVFRNEKAAFLLAGWASKKDGDLSKVRNALDNIDLSLPKGELPELSAREKSGLAAFYNNVGLAYVRRKNDAASLNWFKLATELDSSNGQYFANRAYILGQLGRADEALALLDETYKRFPKAFGLQTQRCVLLAQKGEAEGANQDFLELIGRGLRDEDKLGEWVVALQGAGKHDLAEVALTEWNKKQPSPKTQTWQAGAIATGGDLKRAIQFLEQIIEKSGFDHKIAVKLGDLLNEAGEHERAAEAARKILDSKPQDPDALQILGWSHMGRKAYVEAKATFEKAAAILPNDEEVAHAVQRASMALGQGRNSDVKIPLEPVPLPAELQKQLEKPSIAGLETEGRPMIVLARSTGYHFEKGKPLRTTLRRKFRVLNQAGVNLLSSLDYSFHQSSERIYVNHLKVTEPDGTVIANGSVDDLYVRDVGGEMGTEEKVLTIPVPGLRPDCEVDIEVTKEDRSTAKEFNLVRHTFGYRMPCGIETVYVTGDVRDLKTTVTHTDRVKTIRKPKLLAWSVGGMQPLPDEPYSPVLTEAVPALVISSHAESWGVIGKKYLSDIADRLKPQREVRELVQKICGDLKSDEEKIRALTREVQKMIGYKAIEFGVRARIPNHAADTLRYRYGDCKDQSLLLHQMLKEAGIESYLALVHSSEKVLDDLPTLDQFNHMVLHVPALSASPFLDPTAKYHPITLPVLSVPETHALIVDPAGSRLMASSFVPTMGTADVESRRTLKADGNDWHVTEAVTLKGYYGAAIRRGYDQLTPAEQMRQAQGYLAGDGLAEIKEFKFENLDKLEEPARITMSYVVRDAIKRSNGKAIAMLPALWERSYVNLDYLPERKSPFVWRYPFRMRSELTLQIPGAKPIQAASQKGSGKGVRWAMSQNGSASVAFEFDTEAGRWEPQEYAGIYDQWAAARRVWDSPIEWN